MTFDELLICRDYEEVEDMIDSFTRVESEIVEQSRWSTFFRQVLKDPKTGRFIEYHYERGSTEYQDIDRSEMQWDVREVFPVEKTITVYKTVYKPQ